MKNIHVLDESVANLIAAGEVVERPSAAVKEMVENAIDAGATKIQVAIQNGGISSIMVSDNGCGIAREDVPYAFLPHATSKIQTAEDLDAIYTLGFRGEALASIAAVSKIALTTKTSEDAFATFMEMEAGELSDIHDIGGADGTTIVVKDLFYNTPARMKFLKKDSTEAGYIGDILLRYALSYPQISFKYMDNNRVKFFTPGDNNLKNCLYILYGKDYSENAREVNYENEYAKINGIFVSPNIVRKNSNYQSFYVNHRYIKSVALSTAVKEACREKVVAGNFPVFCLNIEVNPALVDVNVHPSKLEVKFSNERAIFDVVYWGVKNALTEKTIVYEMTADQIESAKTEPIVKELNSIERVYEKKQQDPLATIRDSSKVPYETKKAVEKPKDEQDFSVKQVFAPEQNAPLSQLMGEDSAIESNAEKVSQLPEKENDTAAESTREQMTLLTAEKKEPIRIIGQLFSTYLLLERGRDLLLMDQHAAHERLNFERLKREYDQEHSYAQMLLEPVTIDLSPVEYQKVLDHLPFFSRIGFETENFGNQTVVVRTAPIGIPIGEFKSLFLEMLNVVGTREEEKTRMEKALHMIACRSAIKAHDKMTFAEMEKLVADVMDLKDINTCPHGRPIILTMNEKEIEKGFLRIV